MSAVWDNGTYLERLAHPQSPCGHLLRLNNVCWLDVSGTIPGGLKGKLQEGKAGGEGKAELRRMGGKGEARETGEEGGGGAWEKLTRGPSKRGARWSKKRWGATLIGVAE